MKRFVALITAFLLLSALPAAAQNVTAKVIPTCGTETIPLTPGNSWIRINQQGQLCVSASVSASITGFPTSQSTGTPIAVTTGGVTGTLPTGAVVVASNVGTTNNAYCKLGASATTSDQMIPPSSWFAFTVGASTQLTCITSTSTTTVNMVGGSGLPTGSGGGGGGGGGGGAVTVADGADVTQGANADAVVAAGAAGTVSAKLRRLTTDIDSIKTLAAAATPVTDQVGGAVTALVGDPCQTTAKTTVTFTLATAAVKVAITGVSAKKLYVCAYELQNNAADSVAIFEATTGTTCATAAAALIGAGTSVATAGTGFNFGANGGIARGNGAAQVLATLTNAADLCIAQSAATQLSGSFTYAAR